MAGPRLLVVGIVVAAAAALAAAHWAGDTTAVAHRPRSSLGELLATRTTDLSARGASRLSRSQWLGGPTTASSGEAVNVNVADSIPDPDLVRQQWADFFAGLVHGGELQLLTVYVVPGADVGTECGGGADVLGCYGGQQLVMPGDVVHGVAPEEIARHEYGHHIANNRLNPPWRAIDWGPKRWAAQANVCSSTQRGLTFPGNEDDHYLLNPGEAWAETYRALIDSKTGLPISWQVVDGSFYPGPTALAAAEQDVVAPWLAPTTHRFRGRLTATQKTWTSTLATPLDGDVRATLSLPRSRLYRLTVFSGDRKTVLARGLWSGARTQTATFTVCGQRSLVVQVTGDGRPGRFSLTTSSP